MKRLSDRAISALIVSMMAISGSASAAEGDWARSHPRRTEVNGRLENQAGRINREVREGELTRGQARALHREDRAIRREERTMARFDHGHITRGGQRLLNQQENAISRQIGR